MVQVFTLGISGSQGTQHQGFFIIRSLYLYPSTVAFTKQLLIGSLYPLPLLCCVIFFNSSLHHENHWRCDPGSNIACAISFHSWSTILFLIVQEVWICLTNDECVSKLVTLSLNVLSSNTYGVPFKYLITLG